MMCRCLKWEYFKPTSRLLIMKAKLASLIFLLAVFVPFYQVQAGGLIVVSDVRALPAPRPPIIDHPIHPPRPWPVPRPWVYRFAPMEVQEQKVSIKVTGQIAETTVKQVFYNPNRSRLEGHFIFPVPKGAVLTDFRMDINGEMQKAELLKAQKARKIYEDIVRNAQDPALLEYAQHDLYKVRIFPIEPNSTKRTRVTYKQVLKKDSGLVTYKYPLNTGKYSAKPIKTLSMKMEIESQTPLKSIYSPSHEVEIKRDGAKKAVIGYEQKNVLPENNFAIYFTPQKTELGLNLLTHRPDPDEDGYFLLLLSPGIDVKQEKVVEKDVAFVLDTSGSMAGKKIEQAKKALEFCLHNLNDGDRFEVVRFSTEVETLFSELKEVSDKSRKKALKFVGGLKPIGGTAINDALATTLKLRPEKSKRPFVVIFLTDGRPTVGITGEKQIVQNVKDEAGKTRVFCFGIGNDVNTHLLDKITESTRAFSQYVRPFEDIEVKVSQFYTKINEPVLADPDVVVSWEVNLKQFYPAPLPDVFKGDQMVVVGRYSGKGKGDLLLAGMVNGKQVKMEYSVEFQAESDEHDFIPRLWATRRVGYLLDQIRLHGENKELKEEVTTLAKKYGIVTPFTAYLILEDDRINNVAVNRRLLGGIDRDAGAVRALKENLKSLKMDKSGAGAVAAARAQQYLLQAKAPNSGLTMSNTEAAGSTANLRASASAANYFAGARGGQVQQNIRFVAGRSFYQNGTCWIDAEVQALNKQTKKIGIKFGSKAYFKLVAEKPSALKWISLGKHVEFVLDGNHYEIYQDTKNENN
ncbi:MAG: trypsin [Verrucomicrobiales bacterium]|nr:trypsin [Verrucomicrobiales bacterium]